MRIVEFSKKFEKSYKLRISPNTKLKKQFAKRYALFVEGVEGYPINDHQLFGELIGKRSFSVNGDIRVIYEVIDGVCLFIDIGSHSQVY